MRVGGSCRRTGSFGSGQVQPVPDEFHEDGGFGGSREKFREGIAKGDGDDLLGGGQAWPDGPDTGAGESPDQLGGRGGEDLKQALGDQPELEVAMAGRDLSADGVRGARPRGHPGRACDLWCRYWLPLTRRSCVMVAIQK